MAKNEDLKGVATKKDLKEMTKEKNVQALGRNDEGCSRRIWHRVGNTRVLLPAIVFPLTMVFPPAMVYMFLDPLFLPYKILADLLWEDGVLLLITPPSSFLERAATI